MNAAKLAPLEAVKNASMKCPGIWDMIEWVRGKGIEFGYKWDESICRYPIAYAIGALTKLGASSFDATGMGGFYAALAMWRREKRIYRYDPDLMDEVLETADDLVIPVEVLRRMPAQCLFIQYPEHGSDVAGFFAWIECDVERNSQELRIFYIDRGGEPLFQSFIHLIPGGTISDGISEAKRRILENANVSPGVGIALKSVEESRQITIESVQLLLYVCAENADMEENEEQKRIYKPGQKIADRFREVRKWDVGENVGEQIRIIKARKSSQPSSANESTESVGSKTHRYKNRPHMRRAHWHHYWTGVGRTKLTLKWINSMLVNAEDGEIDVTVQDVQKKENPEGDNK